MAGAERIELPTVVLETIIIPFNYAPICRFHIILALLNKPYRTWDYNIIEWAILGTFWEAFEWIFMRLAPIVVIVLTTILLIKKNK